MADMKRPSLKNNWLPVLALAVAPVLSGAALAECVTIQSGTLVNSSGETISPGFDMWGYNYGAHMFNGTYCDAYRDAAWCQPYKDIEVLMKWNDAWLSSSDCDGDGLLDRHLGYSTYIGSGAWETNHQSGWVPDANGRNRKWTYFVKIVAADEGDERVRMNELNSQGEYGYWERAGVILGPIIWNEFAVVEEVYNDPTAGAHGVLYKSPVGPGLGNLN